MGFSVSPPSSWALLVIESVAETTFVGIVGIVGIVSLVSVVFGTVNQTRCFLDCRRGWVLLLWFLLALVWILVWILVALLAKGSRHFWA